MNFDEMVEKIKLASNKERLVIFIGAGVSNNSGYDSWYKLVGCMDKILNGKSRTKYSDRELLQIPQYMKNNYEADYKKIILKKFDKKIEKTNEIIDILLQLNPKHIITTNFDELIEYSISKNDYLNGKINGIKSKYDLIGKDSDFINSTKNNLIIKMHGDFHDFSSIVLAEDDYLAYSTTHPITEIFIKSLLINHTFLFVGYGINDINLKLIMSYIDTLVSGNKMKNKDNIHRAEFFYINSYRNNRTTEMDKKYYEMKNIYTLELLDLPDKYLNEPINIFKKREGNDLYRILNYLTIIPEKPTSIDFIYDKLICFDNRNAITYEEIENAIEVSNSVSKTYGETFYYDPRFIHFLPRYNLIIDIINSKHTSNEMDYIKSVFAKAEIYYIKELGKDERIQLNDHTSPDEIFEAMLKNDLLFLKTRIVDHAKDSKIELRNIYIIHLLNEFDNDDENIERLKIIEKDFFENDNYFYYIVSEYNLIKILGTNKHYIELKEDIPLNVAGTMKTLLEFLGGFHDLYIFATSTINEIKDKYSAYNSRSNISMWGENADFKELRTKIKSIIYYCNKNYIFTFRAEGLRGENNLALVFSVYIEGILYLTSPICKHRVIKANKYYEYEKIDIIDIDIYLIINVLDFEKLKFLLIKYQIKQLRLSREARELLLQNFSNLVKYIYVYENVQLDFFDMIGKCCLLLKFVEFDSMEIDNLLSDIETLILAILDREHYLLLYKSLIVGVMELIEKLKNDLVSRDWFEHIMNVLLNATIKCVDTYIQTINDSGLIIFLSEHIKNKQKLYSSTHQYFEGLMNKGCVNKNLLIQIYSLCEPAIQDKIMGIVYADWNHLNNRGLHLAIWQRMLKVDEATIQLLKERCLSFGKSLDYTSPFEIIIELHRDGFIKDLSCFDDLFGLNDYFDFICYPDKFDYNKFKIIWCRWLLLPKYSFAAMQHGKEILHNLFLEEMENGATDIMKEVYYRVIIPEE